MEGADQSTAGGNGAAGIAVFVHTEQRIAWLTLVLGAATAIIVAVMRRWAWAEGLAIGTVLAWLNFRWLKRGLDALVAVSAAQEGIAKPRIPFGTWFRLMFRYGLIAFCVYVIFEYLKVPLASMVVGLCALGAATIAASVYEILRPTE
jgi:predicted membrane chloride channel (bestrophin family)